MASTNTANKHNIRLATCLQCGNPIAPGDGYAAPLASNGGRSQYVCWNCMQGYNDFSYGQHAHSAATGKQAKSGLTYSAEFEARGVDALTRGEMAAAGFIATKDCTTEVEYKMPPRGNLNNAKTWSTIERLAREGHLTITPSDGTHIHVGHGDVEHPQADGNPTPDLINPRTMARLRTYSGTILYPLVKYMHYHIVGTVKVFGRDFNSYARYGVSPDVRYMAINITNSTTIEYRLPKFRTADQYRHCLKTCGALTKCIVTNFMAYANDPDADPYKLQHKAEVTASKLIKVWKKYAAAAPTWEDANGESYCHCKQW